MDAFQQKSQVDDQQQQHLDLGLQSDPPIDYDKLVDIVALELQNLVISSTHVVLDRDLPGSSVVMDDDEQVKRAIDEELPELVVKEAVNEAFQAESSSGSGENNYQDEKQLVDEAIERHGLIKVIEEDPKECRVLEEPGVGEIGIGCEKEEEKVVDDDEKSLEHEEDLKEKQEIEIDIEDGGGSSEIVGYENNGEGRRSEDGNDREFQNVEDLENESENAGGEGQEGGLGMVPDDGRLKRYNYPLRPDAEDCSYYMRTGTCKFGSNCKFNHPLRRRNQPSKETKKQMEENLERPGQIECKFYLSSVGCKYGKSCKFNHGRGKTVATPVAEYNFLGLPIRPGERECPYYMRNGSCKYGPNCRFNHPDPTAVGGGDAPTTYGNDGPVPLQSASQANIPSWSVPRTPDGSAAFLPVIYSPTQSMPPPNPDWNGYQAPAPPPAHVYPNSERGLPIPPAFFLNNPPSDTNLYTHHQQQMLVSDYPERPGQPECSYFMKTGDCKYRTACKFHHPKSRITKTPPSVLSDKGLPLRPDQNICTHYSRYGICKYGPACKYDHPANYSNSMPPAGEAYGSDGHLMQQSV